MRLAGSRQTKKLLSGDAITPTENILLFLCLRGPMKTTKESMRTFIGEPKNTLKFGRKSEFFNSASAVSPGTADAAGF